MLNRRLTLFSPILLLLLAIPVATQEATPTQIGVVQTETAVQVVGPATDWPADLDAAGVTLHTIAIGEERQKLRTSWISGGLTIEVETPVGNGTNGTELAISRHAKLVRRTLLEFPKDP